MTRQKHTIVEFTKEAFRQLASYLGCETDEQTPGKKMMHKGAYLTPEAFDTRMNAHERKNLLTAQAPR